jgi:hypothetical protein
MPVDAESRSTRIEFARWMYVTGCGLTLVGYFGFGGPDGEGAGEWLWHVGWALVGVGLLAESGMRVLARRTRDRKKLT